MVGNGQPSVVSTALKVSMASARMSIVTKLMKMLSMTIMLMLKMIMTMMTHAGQPSVV